eukprot:4705794-Prymnesium_polylepis.1
MRTATPSPPALARRSPPSCARTPPHRDGPVRREHVVGRHQVLPQDEARGAAGARHGLLQHPD